MTEDDYLIPAQNLLNHSLDQYQPNKLTIQGDGDNKIEIFYDRENKRWDCIITGGHTEPVKTFVKYILDVLPVYECQRVE